VHGLLPHIAEGHVGVEADMAEPARGTLVCTAPISARLTVADTPPIFRDAAWATSDSASLLE